MLQWLRMRHYWSILISQIILLFLSAFLKHSLIVSILFVTCLFGVFGSVIETIWQRRLPRILALICGLVAVVGGVIGYIPGITMYEIEWDLFISCLAYAVFILIAIFSISRYVYVTDRITSDRIVGSICIYMLIGLFFAFVYAVMGLVMNDAFNYGGVAPTLKGIFLSDFIYFSYSTLTTIGYGDVTPLNPVVKMTACLEGVTGSVYLAIMVARLVGMHVTQSHAHKS